MPLSFFDGRLKINVCLAGHWKGTINWGDKTRQDIEFSGEESIVSHGYEKCGEFKIVVDLESNPCDFPESIFAYNYYSMPINPVYAFSKGKFKKIMFNVKHDGSIFEYYVQMWNGVVLSEMDYFLGNNIYYIYVEYDAPTVSGNYPIKFFPYIECDNEPNYITILDPDLNNIEVKNYILSISSITPDQIIFSTISEIDFGDGRKRTLEIPSKETISIPLDYTSPGVYILTINSIVSSFDGSQYTNGKYTYTKSIVVPNIILTPIVTDITYAYNTLIPLASFNKRDFEYSSKINWNNNLPNLNVPGEIIDNIVYGKWILPLKEEDYSLNVEPNNNYAITTLSVSAYSVRVKSSPIKIIPFFGEKVDGIANPLALLVQGLIFRLESPKLEMSLRITPIVWSNGIVTTPTIKTFPDHRFEIYQDFLEFGPGKYFGILELSYNSYKQIFNLEVEFPKKGNEVILFNPRFKACKMSRRLIAIVNQPYDKIYIQFENGDIEIPNVVNMTDVYVTRKFRPGKHFIYLYLEYEGYISYYQTYICAKCH